MMSVFSRREHRLGLLVAAGLGAAIGAVFMLGKAAACLRPFLGGSDLYFLGVSWSPFLGSCWFTIISWPTLGAMSAAAIVVVVQLLRA